MGGASLYQSLVKIPNTYRRLHTDTKPTTAYCIEETETDGHFLMQVYLCVCSLIPINMGIQRTYSKFPVRAYACVSCFILSKQECNVFVFKISCLFKPIMCVFLYVYLQLWCVCASFHGGLQARMPDQHLQIPFMICSSHTVYFLRDRQLNCEYPNRPDELNCDHLS